MGEPVNSRLWRYQVHPEMRNVSLRARAIYETGVGMLSCGLVVVRTENGAVTKLTTSRVTTTRPQDNVRICVTAGRVQVTSVHCASK